jgi:nucleotide-binding universal stress UspA family protein
MSMKIETVLIGTTLTEASDRVVRMGMKLARSAGAKAHLVHAYAPPMTYIGSPFVPDVPLTEVLAAEQGALQSKLESQLERLVIRRGELTGVTLEAGPAHRLLTETAEAVGADLMVVGAAEAVRLARVFGSTADRVVRRATCPVLVIRGELSLPPRKVLLPIDLSPLSADAFELGLHLLAQVAGPAAHLEAAQERIPEVEAFFVAMEPEHRTTAAETEITASLTEEEVRRFATIHSLAAAVGWPIAARVAYGFVDSQILDRIGQWMPDLVILGTHGRGGFERFLLGSVANTVVREGGTNILVIPPKAVRREAAVPAEMHAAA